MARKNANNVQEEVYESSGGGLAWLGWVVLSLVALILLVSVLHMSGVMKGPEEAIYSATKDVPVVRSLTGWMHREEGIAADLSPEEAISAKDIANNLIRAERKIQSLEKQNKEMITTLEELAEVAKKIDRLDKKMKELEEYGGVAPAVAAAAAQAPPRIAVPTGAGAGAAAMVAVSGENFRLVAKIFEKIESDTAVDILNNLSDGEKVKILSGMKESTVAEILTAFDPIKSAKITLMLANASH